MNSINGSTPQPDPADSTDFLDEKISTMSDFQTTNQKLNGMVTELFVIHKKNVDSEILEARSLNIFIENCNLKNNKKIVHLNPDQEVIIGITRQANGNSKLESHEKIKHLLEGKQINLQRLDSNNKEITEALDKRKITYVGLNDEQYNSIFLIANQYIDRIAKDHEKIKENHESNASFYQERSFKKLPPTKATKKIVNLLMNSKFAEEFQRVIDKMDNSSLKKKREHNKIEKDKALEERIEYYEIKEKNREIRREDDDNFLKKHEEND